MNYIIVNHKPHSSASAIVEQFYPSEMIEDVTKNFHNNKNVIEKFGAISCWNCNNCDYVDSCWSKEHDRIFMILKDQYYSNISISP